MGPAHRYIVVMSGADDLLQIAPSDGGLSLTGEIDAHTAPDLAAAIGELSGNVQLELSGVEFVDSSGLRVLIDAHQSVSGRGDEFKLSQPSDAVRRLLEISGVDEYLTIV